MKVKPGVFTHWTQMYSFVLWVEFFCYGILGIVFATRHNTYAWIMCGFCMFAVARVLGMIQRYWRDQNVAVKTCREVWEKYKAAYDVARHNVCEAASVPLYQGQIERLHTLIEQYEEVIERFVDCRTLPKQWREYRSSEQSEPPFVQ